MLYLTNTFTLGMLKNEQGSFTYQKITLEEARELAKQEFISAVGHEATAQLMSYLLGVQVPFNRIQIAVKPGDILLVCQVHIRLEEGKILSLPELQKLYGDGKIAFYKVIAG